MREKFRENKLQMLIKKILYTSDLVSTTILTTKLSEVENKIPNNNNLVTTKREICQGYIFPVGG